MHREELVGIQTIWWVDYQLAVGFLTGSWKSNMDVWISNQLFGNPTAYLSWPRCNGDCSCLLRPRSPWFKEGRRWQQGSSSAGQVCHHMLEKGATSWFPKSPNRCDQKRKWKFLCTKIYQVVLSSQRKLVLEHFLLISFLKIQIWNTGISFLFDHVVPQWPAGPLRSNHYNFCNRNLSNNRIFPNNRRKPIYQIIRII